jgi:putative transposase
MNPPKCDALDYINFLVAAQRAFSAVEAARTHPAGEDGPAHDAYTRLLQRAPADGEALWQEVEPLVHRTSGVLIIDDTTLDKPYASKMALVTRHWSGKHRSVVQGINLVSLVWTDGDCRLPCDYRLYNKAQDGLSKNDHFEQMIRQAKQRSFEPELVAFDSWYASLKNLKLVRQCGWHWLTQLKSNRLVSIDRSGNRPIRDIFLPPIGTVVHLKGYDWVKVFKTVGINGDVEYWATSNLNMTLEQCAFYALDAWQVEVYHRGLKQFTGVERAQFRLEIAQRNHIGLAIRAYLRLEAYRLRTRISWFEAKTSIIREAIRTYLAHPSITLCPTA